MRLPLRDGFASTGAPWLVSERRDRWLVGTVEEVAERVASLGAVGVTRVFLQHLNHGDDEMVALVGERLLPSVR